MHSPVMHHDYLFIASKHRVLVFNQTAAENLERIDYFYFPEPVLSIGKHFDNLLVTTRHEEYIICGGPSAASMYVILLKRR